MHNVVPHYRKYPEVDAYVRRLMSREADGIIFHDEHARNDFMHKFGNISGKQFVVPHAVYPESLVPLPSRELARHYFRIPPEPLCALFLGQARKKKGYDYILSALDSFQKKGIHVVFAARGADSRQRNMAWKANITFLPYFVPNYEMPVLFSAVDVVLLPYRSCTTSGLAVLSVGFGRPFVSSKLAPLLRLCSAGLGVSCDVENPIEFADHVLLAGDMVHNPRYVRGRNKFLEEHSLDRVAADTFEIYARLVNR